MVDLCLGVALSARWTVLLISNLLPVVGQMLVFSATNASTWRPPWSGVARQANPPICGSQNHPGRCGEPAIVDRLPSAAAEIWRGVSSLTPMIRDSWHRSTQLASPQGSPQGPTLPTSPQLLRSGAPSRYNGQGQRAYDVGRVPTQIIDTGDYLYLLTGIRLYVLRDNTLCALLEVAAAGRSWCGGGWRTVVL